MRPGPLLIALCGGLFACVQGRSDDFLTADRERDPPRPVTPTTAPPPPPRDAIPPPPPPPFDASRVAAGVSDDLACLRAVSELEAQERTADGFALLGACAQQGKWRDLRRVLQAPWRGRLAKLEESEAMVLLVRVIANRGGLFDSDIPLCNLNRVELHQLSEAYQGGAVRPGSWVVLRAFAGRERSSKKEKRSMELKELLRGSKDQGAEETGATVAAVIDPALPPLEEGAQYIFVGRLGGPVGTNADGYPHSKLVVAGAFRPGRILPDLSP